MSKTRDINYKCPYCGKEFNISIYDRVDIKEDPDLHDRCLSGEIFQHECPQCHESFLVQNNLLYIDIDHKFVLMVVDESMREADLSSLAKPLDEAGYRLRRCVTVKDFVEKIMVLEDGLDDVAIELAKYDCFIEFIDNKKGKAEDVTDIQYQNCDNGVFKINVKTGDKGMSFLIPTALITEELEASGLTVFNKEFPAIDSDWLISQFTERARANTPKS